MKAGTKPTRCFRDVRDVVLAIIGLAGHPSSAGKVFNIGSTEVVSILELAKRIKDLTGSSSEIRFVPYDQAYPPGFEDMRRRVPDLSRIKALLDWQPTRQLDEILSEVIASELRAAP